MIQMGLAELVSRLSIFKTGLDLLLPLPPPPLSTQLLTVFVRCTLLLPLLCTRSRLLFVRAPTVAKEATKRRSVAAGSTTKVICKLSPRRSVDIVVAKLLLRMAASVGGSCWVEFTLLAPFPCYCLLYLSISLPCIFLLYLLCMTCIISLH